MFVADGAKFALLLITTVVVVHPNKVSQFGSLSTHWHTEVVRMTAYTNELEPLQGGSVGRSINEKRVNKEGAPSLAEGLAAEGTTEVLGCQIGRLTVSAVSAK